MDVYEQETGRKREAQSVTHEYGVPGTEDYLKVVYILPDPYTDEEFCVSLDDFNKRYDAGERTKE